MSLKIRLARAGAKKKPFYRIVVTDSRSPRDGRFIEKVGYYNPLLNNDDEKRVVLETERIQHWLSVGAQPSDRVHRFLSDVGIVEVKVKNNPVFSASSHTGKRNLAAINDKRRQINQSTWIIAEHNQPYLALNTPDSGNIAKINLIFRTTNCPHYHLSNAILVGYDSGSHKLS